MRSIVLTRIIFIPSLALLSVTGQATDYSDCARFFNNLPASEGNPRGYRTHESSPFIPERLRLSPFVLNDDGSVSLLNEATLTIDRYPSGTLRTQTIGYRSPDIESLETLDPERFSGAEVSVNIVIERNEQGEIVKITENLGLVTDIEAEFVRTAEWNGGDDDLAHAYMGTETTFKVAADQCVPLKRRELLVRPSEQGPEDTEVHIFDTELCYRLYGFLSDELSDEQGYYTNNIFRDEINDPIVTLFARHARYLIEPEDYDPFLSNERINDIMNPRLNELRMLRLQVLLGFMAGTQFPNLRQQVVGASALISGYMVVAACHYDGLTEFLYDDDLWPEIEQ